MCPILGLQSESTSAEGGHRVSAATGGYTGYVRGSNSSKLLLLKFIRKVATQTGDVASFHTCERHDKFNNNSSGEGRRKVSQLKEVPEGN